MNRLSPAQELVAALTNGGSILVTGTDGTASLLESVGHLLARTRTRIIRVGPPLDLPEFIRQVTLATPASNANELEQGFAALTELDPACDRIALLVEEAHLLRHETLRYIEFALRNGSYLQVALAGGPEIADTLALSGFAGLRRRISLHIELPERLRAAAPEPRSLFEPAPAPVRPPMPASTPSFPVARALPPRRRAARFRRPVALAGGTIAASLVAASWLLWPSPEQPITLVRAEAELAASSVAAPQAALTAAPATASQDAAPGVLDAARTPLAAAETRPDLPSALGPPAVPTRTVPEPPTLEPAALQHPLPEPPTPGPIKPQPNGHPATDTSLASIDVPEPEAPPPVQVVPAPAPDEPDKLLAVVPQPPLEVEPVPALADAAAVPMRPIEPQAAVAAISEEVREPDPLPVPPVVVAAPPALPVATFAASAPSVPPRPPRMQPRVPAARAETVAVRPVVAEDARRCRDIILRVQLGENPSDGDRSYLRNGCR